MNATFLDTSYLIALVSRKDEWHKRAIEWKRVLPGGLATTEDVLVEFMDAMTPVPLRQMASRTIELVRSSSGVQVVPASTSLLEEGLSIFKNRADKLWGLTDCISFVVMNRQGIVDALTSDRHFEQAGFRALLRLEPSVDEQ